MENKKRKSKEQKSRRNKKNLETFHNMSKISIFMSFVAWKKDWWTKLMLFDKIKLHNKETDFLLD